MQPVYLNTPGVRRVTLEGPALRIHSRDQADRFMPLNRLSRVVCRGNVQWSTAAMIRCMQAGVTITFLDREGRAVGMCLGDWPQYSPLSELLDAFFTLDEGPARLVDWFRSQSRNRLIRLLHKHDIQCPDLRVRAVRKQLRRFWQMCSPAAGHEPVTRMKPLAAAQISEILTSYRFSPALMEAGSDWSGLVCYLTGILEWRMWELAFDGRLVPRDDTFFGRVKCYQRIAPTFDKEIRDIIGRLWRWLENSEAYTP